MAGTILVADDDDTILGLVAYLLEDEGYRVLRASDGAEALACAQREAPDLVLTDIMMPRMTGVELLARLRAAPALAVPVILMSAVTRAPNPLPPRTAFLPKPFELAALLELVSRLLPAS
jgi:two-component system response regulator VicR